MFYSGTPITIAATGTAQQLTTSIGNVHSITIMQHWDNTHKLVIGTSALVEATPVGVLGWIAPPNTNPSVPYFEMTEESSPNGLKASSVWISGTVGDIVLWKYEVE